jgi:hypothetical protein
MKKRGERRGVTLRFFTKSVDTLASIHGTRIIDERIASFHEALAAAEEAYLLMPPDVKPVRARQAAPPGVKSGTPTDPAHEQKKLEDAVRTLPGGEGTPPGSG